MLIGTVGMLVPDTFKTGFLDAFAQLFFLLCMNVDLIILINKKNDVDLIEFA